MTLTLTLDRVILHTVGRTYVLKCARMYGHLKPALLGRLCRRVDLKMVGEPRLASLASNT